MTKERTTSDIELQQIEYGPWAVVCTDLHACMAPLTKKDAEEAAKRLTSLNDGCTYRSVPVIVVH